MSRRATKVAHLLDAANQFAKAHKRVNALWNSMSEEDIDIARDVLSDEQYDAVTKAINKPLAASLR